MSGEVRVAGLEFEVHEPSRLSMEEWSAIQRLLRREFAATIGVHPRYLDASLHWDDLPAFQEERINPVPEDSEGIEPHQEFSSPLAILAKDEGQIVGYMYSVNNNFSLLDPLRTLIKYRELPIIRPYHLIPEAVVSKRYRRRGIASVMAGLAISRRLELQPTVTHVPMEAEDIIGKMMSQSYGFKPSGIREKDPSSGANIRLARMQVASSLLLKNLHKKPGFGAALSFAQVAHFVPFNRATT